MAVLDVSNTLKADALTGPAKIVYAPIAQAVPANISDIIAMVGVSGVYAPFTGYKEFGLAADAPSYTRGIESEGIEYDNVQGPLFERITAINRQLTANVGSINPENAMIWENAPAVATIAAAAGKSAQSAVKIGTFEESAEYRVAIICQRPKKAVLVTEPGGVTRGGLVVLSLYRCTLAAEDLELSFGSDEAIAGEITFTVFPELTVTNPAQQYGQYFFEQAGTIA